jgi:hypothetical protein
MDGPGGGAEVTAGTAKAASAWTTRRWRGCDRRHHGRGAGGANTGADGTDLTEDATAGAAAVRVSANMGAGGSDVANAGLDGVGVTVDEVEVAGLLSGQDL